MALRNIVLHGDLGARYGEKHQLSVETAAEAIRAMSIQIKGFGDAIRDGSYHVLRSPKGGTPDFGAVDMDIDMVKGFRLGAGDLHIMPVIAGSKRSGLLKVILGVALIGAAFVFSGGTLAGTIPLGLSGINMSYGSMAMVGLAVAASGVSQLLAPEEKDDKSTDSYILTGPTNSYQEGAAIPLVYGEVYTGGVVISAGMDAEDLLTDVDKDGDHDEDDGTPADDDETNDSYVDPWGRD
jgi:predicted phage tail protein